MTEETKQLTNSQSPSASSEGRSESDSLKESITHPKKLAFLENYPRLHMVSKTAEAIGINRHTAFMWLREDDIFFTAFTVLKKEIDSHRLELYEAELEKRALFGSKNSDILLMFALKSLDRDRYEGRQVQQNFTGNIIVQSAIPKPDYVVTETTKIPLSEGNKLLPRGEKDFESLPVAVNDDKED